MTRRIGLTLAGVLLVLLPLAGAASAQSYPPPENQDQQVTPTEVTPGQPFTVSGGGFAPGSTVTVRFDAQVLGTVLVRPNGTFTGTFTTPADAKPGAHTISSTGTAPDGTQRVLRSTIQVLGTAADRAGTLPRTGTGLTMPLATSAGLLIGAGAVAIVATRRRRRA